MLQTTGYSVKLTASFDNLIEFPHFRTEAASTVFKSLADLWYR